MCVFVSMLWSMIGLFFLLSVLMRMMLMRIVRVAMISVRVFVVVRVRDGVACSQLFQSLVPGPWSLSFGPCSSVTTSTFNAASPPRLTFRISRRAPTFKRGSGVRKHIEGDARIHKRPQQHVAADSGKALQIANSHRLVILNCLVRDR